MTKHETKILTHPLTLARMLWKHRLLAVVAVVICAAAGAAVVSRLPKVYQAEALVLVDSQKIPERFVAATVQVALQDHLAMISQQILSATQLEGLIKKYRLYENLKAKKSPEQIIELMRSDIRTPLERGWGTGRSGAFRVIYQGRDPAIVANVVNEIAGMFIAENLRTREQRAAGTSDFIESQLAEARKQLEEQEAAYSRFKLSRMGELPEQEASINGTLSRLQTELQGVQDAIDRAEQNKLMAENTLRAAEEAEAAAMRAIRESTARPTAVPRAETGPATTPPLPSELLRNELQELQLRYQDEHPEVKRAKAALEAALKREAQEARAVRGSGGSTGGQFTAAEESRAAQAAPQLRADLSHERERRSNAHIQLELASKELESRTAERRRILASIATYEARLDRLPVRERELAAITRDYENSKQNYRSLLEKKASAVMAAEMERRQQAERFTLQDPARVPTRPIKPKMPLLLGGVMLASLAFGAGIALAIEFPKDQLLGEWELPPGVTVIGRLPVIGAAAAGSGPRRLRGASAALLAVAAVLAGGMPFHV